MISTGEQRTALYRFYDADVKLLYVGITNDPWRRWREHVREQPWYPQVKHQAVTWYETKFAAEKAERAAIRCEHPRFNVAGADDPDLDDLPAEFPAADLEPEAAIEPEPERRLELPPEVPQEALAEPVLEPDPELEEEDPAPDAAPAGWQADPLLHTRRGRRMLITVLTCIAWGFLPSFPGMPKDWHSPWMIGLVASTPVPVIVFFLIAFAPKIHRFGRWLDLNFSPPQGSPGK